MAPATTSRPGPRRTTNLRGFTLLEVVLAMTLLVMLVGTAVFAFSGWQRNAALNEGADRFAILLRAGRLEAAQLGKRVRVVFENADDVTGDATFRMVWEPDPLGAPGEFVPYEGALIARSLGEDDLVRVRRCRLTGDAAYAAVWLGDAADTDLAPVTFYPDGSGDSAQVVLVSVVPDDRRGAVVEVDGLTGDVSAGVMSPEGFLEWLDENP